MKGRNTDGGEWRAGGATHKKSGSARLANAGASRASSARGWEYFYLPEVSVSRGVGARRGRDESTRRRITRRIPALSGQTVPVLVVLCPEALPLHSPPREKSRFFSREIFRGPPSVFPERGARRSARPRRDAPRHSRRAFARVGSPLVSRGLPRSGARPNPRRARTLRPAPSRDSRNRRARETRNLPRVRQRVVVAG